MPDTLPRPDDEDLAAIDTPRAILERLVAFPTVSRDSNLALVDWVEAWLAARGIEAVRVPNAGGDKASLYAHVGPRTDGGVLLSGHTDVVPVDGQDWSCDPWCVTERDGRLYGRGTADMKGFDALALWAIGEAARRGVARPLQIALSRDEEIGCVGAPEMLAHMAGSGFPKAEAAIIGEPTGMACVTAHKSSVGFRVEVRGHEVHSSMQHRGVSAVMEAARLIDWANRTNAETAARTPSAVAALFDPPWSSLHVGVIEGGTADNIMARSCRFNLGLRTVPDDPLEAWRDRIGAAVAEVERGMQRIHPGTGIDLREGFLVPALAPETDGAAERLVRALTGDNGTHAASYGTEAGQFQQAGYSAVVCGPGDIAQAHQADEYLALEQLEAGQRFMEKLLGRLAAN